MTRSYSVWVILKSFMGASFMYDSLISATLRFPEHPIAVAVFKSGNFAYLFLGWMLIVSALIGGLGIMSENYSLIGGRRDLSESASRMRRDSASNSGGEATSQTRRA